MTLLQEPIAEEHGGSTTHVYKCKLQKRVINRGKRPVDIDSNEAEPLGDDYEADVTQGEQPKKIK